ncbi:conserved Plasmodium membrane protein, unknown function [Plasmodium malariae]|uniref:Uncharacterized protein n=1 Tax=Plasmodium malariae TaxID=5858 RepID=A0A1A8VQX6_PLAMA|nr:conserved Plasmodium membrane protein, unknown function [Plasmodium malariae]
MRTIYELNKPSQQFTPTVRYNKFSPSDVKMPGVFSDSRKSLDKDMKYATKREIEILRNYCKETGCHTCGVTCHERFIGDHQPPVQVIKDMIQYYKKKKCLLYFLKLFKLYDTKQRLYPQCVRCSQLQSASVRCKTSVNGTEPRETCENGTNKIN